MKKYHEGLVGVIVIKTANIECLLYLLAHRGGVVDSVFQMGKTTHTNGHTHGHTHRGGFSKLPRIIQR